MRWEIFKLYELVCLILEIWQYTSYKMCFIFGSCQCIHIAGHSCHYFRQPANTAWNYQTLGLQGDSRGRNVTHWPLGIEKPLQWCHNECVGISNHQSHDCLLNCLFRRRPKKISKLRVTGLCAGNSQMTGEFPAQMASNTENVSIWWCHHEI